MSSQDSRGGAASSLRDRRVARVIDREIAPIWHDRFARLIVRNLPTNLPNNGEVTALDIHCGVGRTTAELLGRLGAGSRVLALEPDDILLELAKTRMRPEWKNRVYLKAGNFDDVTSMSDDAYNLVVANLVLGETGDLSSALAEMIRVNRIGGRVLATLPMAGTWNEVEDIFSEVLRDAGLHAAVRRLDRLRELRPTGPQLSMLVRQLGVVDDDFVIEQERFHLLFPSGREFLFAPVVEHGPLRLWKAVIGKDGTPQELFWRLKEAIDAYYTGHVLAVNVLAGLINIHVAKGTESPGPRLAARFWRHYPTLDAVWGGLAAGYVRISEPVPFSEGDLDFDLEIDEGSTGRTGAQKTITTSINIITEDIADDDEPAPIETPKRPAAKAEPSPKTPVKAEPVKAEPAAPKTPVKAAVPAKKPVDKSVDDFDAAFAEYEPEEQQTAPQPVSAIRAAAAAAKAAQTAEPERAKPAAAEVAAPVAAEVAAPAQPVANEQPAAAETSPVEAKPRFRLPTSESGKFKPPTTTEPNATSEEPKFRAPTSESGKFKPPTPTEPNATSEEPKFRAPTSESGKFKPPTPTEPNATSEEPKLREPTSESGKFKPPTPTEPNATSEAEPNGTTTTEPDATSEASVAEAKPGPAGESSGVLEMRLRPLGERPSGESGSGFRRPSGESSGLTARPGESSGFFTPPKRPGAEAVSTTGSFKVFAPPKPREAAAPTSGRIRRTSQPLGMADVPKSLVGELDADPATEQAFDRLTIDEWVPEKPAHEEAKSPEEPEAPAKPEERPSPVAEPEAPAKPEERPSLVAGLGDLEAETPLADDAAPLSLTVEPVKREPEAKPPVDEMNRSTRMRLSDLEATTSKPRAESEPNRPRLSDFEATTTPARAKPEPEPEPESEEFDEVDEVEDADEVEEAPVVTKPAKPAPPPLRPGKAPPPPPRDVFKPRPLLPIMPVTPPKKK